MEPINRSADGILPRRCRGLLKGLSPTAPNSYKGTVLLALTLHVDGKQVAESAGFDVSSWNLEGDAALRLGSGMSGPFNGQLADLQIHQRALSENEIQASAT